MVDLLNRVAALVDIASVSRTETELADLVESELLAYDHLAVTRIENNVVARTALGHPHRLLLGGHLDTVPPAGNERSRIETDCCFGCGAADMKGGIAIMLELARSQSSPVLDVTYVFYACEEVARDESGLLAIEAIDAEILACDAAILLEPTSATIEAGCQGALRFEVTVIGERAHSARPWMGINAIHRLGAVIDKIADFEERMPVIDGCTYHESLQAVRIDGGIATNVVPDRARLMGSYRFAPDRSVARATAVLEEYFAPLLERSKGDTLEIVDAAPPAPPSLDSPIIAALLKATGVEARAKLGWTDVAFFAERGIPAANFGPGDPEIAHSAGEFVTRSDLDGVHRGLAQIVGGPSQAS